MTFTQWLMLHKDDECAVGDLARDAADDSSWPTTGATLEAFRSHLLDMRASTGALETLHAAWSEFDAHR